ncbi:MAG TPA: ATP-dependent DNA helicase UvrD2 [Acidimicrobiales bacterium]|nr:ATP-dependent DNA helicase UvrD2 [Acidimicrobiales bacterium]
MAPELGRSVVVAPGQPAPPAWSSCERVAGDDVDALESAWRSRRPVVVDGAVAFADDEVERRAVWRLDPSFSFEGERLAHATFSNAYDARGPGGDAAPVWPWDDVVDGGPLEFRAGVVPRVSALAGSLVPFASNECDADLAPDQLAAVTHPGGAARIIAPAGSGKTRVLTERARHLLRRWNIPGRAVTLVAFNKRAADEMVERTTDLPELNVRTLNSLGLSLVNRSRRVTTIEERDVRSILDSLVDLPRRANTDPAAAWIEALSAVRLGLVDPAVVEGEFGGDVDGLPDVLERYRRVLFERGLVDFDEQIYRAIKILLTDPSARRAARASCRVLLVDEFQDLTPAHLLLIRLLAGPDGCVFGVGDDDQTIYGYSGASPSWLIDYRRYFPTAGEHPLQVNYRCPAPVVDAARTLLTHNRQRVEKTIVASVSAAADASTLTIVDSGDDPLSATVERVSSLVESSGVAPSDVAVLTRVNASLAPVQVALVHHGVPVRAAIDESYLSRGGVVAALAWLRLAVGGSSRLVGADVALAARRPSRALSPKVIEWMSEQRSVRDLERLAGRVGARDEKKILTFVDDVTVVQSVASSGTTADVLRAVRDRVGLDQAMQVLEGSRRRLDRSAQTDDLDALVAVARLHPAPDGFEPWLRASLAAPGSPDGVLLATIHSVKGREWPHVVVHDASAGLLPHRLADDVEEERRVFHVALTRCSSSVTIVTGDAPSPFVRELFEEWTPSRPPVRAAAAVVPASSASAAAREEPVVVAAVGLEIEHGGHRSTIVAVDDEGALVELGRARLRVPFGATVRVDGRLATLAPEPPPVVIVERARDALRAWRLERSRAIGKPAFVVFSDATLDALATAMPSSVVALSRIKGIGPAKLEAYGDDILAVLDGVRGG